MVEIDLLHGYQSVVDCVDSNLGVNAVAKARFARQSDLMWTKKKTSGRISYGRI